MSLTPVQNLQLHNQIDKVLHVPGNYRGGILEMAIVIDCAFSSDAICSLAKDVVASCKKQSEVFRNVRLNVIKWGKDTISADVTAMAYLQTGTFFDDYEMQEEQKSLDELMDYLKRFQARSKLIIFLTPKESILGYIKDKDILIKAMNPFLKQKIIFLYPDKIEGGSDFVRNLILSDR